MALADAILALNAAFVMRRRSEWLLLAMQEGPAVEPQKPWA
jgi:hypothetical protein